MLGHDTLPRLFEYVLVETPQRPAVFAERGVEVILIATEMSGRRVEPSHRFDDGSGYVSLGHRGKVAQAVDTSTLPLFGEMRNPSRSVEQGQLQSVGLHLPQ
jgi:hypothetical protein